MHGFARYLLAVRCLLAIRGVLLNLSHTLFRSARRLPRAVAVIERDRIELSYEQLADRSLRLASALIALGAGPGARVGLLAHNCALRMSS